MTDVVDWIKEHILATISILLTVLITVGGVTFVICGICFIVDYASYDPIFEDEKDEKRPEFLARGLSIIILGIIMAVTSISGCALVISDAICPRIYLMVSLWFLSVLLFAGFAVSLSATRKPSAKDTEGLYPKIIEAMDDAFIREYGIDRFSSPEPTTTPTPTPAPAPPAEAGVSVSPTNATNDGPIKFPVSEVFNLMHAELKCCGSDGPTDFASVEELPSSCCKQPDDSGVCTTIEAYRDGCKEKLVDSLRDTARVLAGFSGFYYAVTVASAVCSSVTVCTWCLHHYGR